MGESDMASLLAELDNGDMAGLTRSFADDLEAAMATEVGIEADTDWSGVLCLGMGGSGAGGRFLKALADDEGGLPFVVWSDYGLPSWWGPDWLVLATSHSGNTEETLDGVRDALESGGTVVGVSSGGQLGEMLDGSDDGVLLTVPGGQMPRSAFGHILGTQLAACWALGLLPAPDQAETAAMLERLRAASGDADLIGGDGMSETMARSMQGREIGIVSPVELGPAGYRFSCQINENSDGFANPSSVPEMNHNEIVAWSSEGASRALIVLTSEEMHPRTQARVGWMLDNIESKVVWRIECEGESLLERLLYAAHVTDWVSIALALVNGTNPSEMAAIDSLKTHLASIQ
jgi:glucose/mannose-6-phosphate isomerase